MKRNLILLPIFSAFLYVILTSNSAGPGGMSGQECTGASGTVGCGGSSCHGSTASPGVSISVQLLSGTTAVTSYVGGASYTIRLRGINTIATSLPKFGFQVSAVKTSTTTNAGTLSAIAGTHLVTVTGINLVEHNPIPLSPTTGTGGGGSTYVVDIPWTAPVAGTGSISLFGVINMVNNNSLADAGDGWKGASQVITEISSTLGPITGTTAICVGGTSTLFNSTPGGVWSSSSTSVATIGSASGIVNGISFGTTTITYNAGSSGSVTTVVTVNPNPATITGPENVCVGHTVTLVTATPGGVWNSSNTSVATVGTGTGVVTGVASGSCTISYSFPTGCATTSEMTVDPCWLDAGSGPELISTGLKVFPNPASGNTSIDVVTPIIGQAHVVITDAVGRIENELFVKTNEVLNLKLKPGEYFISATISGNRYRQKIEIR